MTRMVIFRDPKNDKRPVLATGNRSRLRLVPFLKKGTDGELWDKCNKLASLYNLGRRIDEERTMAAILAGLRLLQQSGHLPPEIMDILTDKDSFDPLSDDEIDGLCETLNCGG